MTRKKVTSAAIQFGITLGTSLLALWSADAVVGFGDVAPVAYGAAAVGALVAATKDLQSSMRDSRQ